MQILSCVATMAIKIPKNCLWKARDLKQEIYRRPSRMEENFWPVFIKPASLAMRLATKSSKDWMKSLNLSSLFLVEILPSS